MRDKALAAGMSYSCFPLMSKAESKELATSAAFLEMLSAIGKELDRSRRPESLGRFDRPAFMSNEKVADLFSGLGMEGTKTKEEVFVKRVVDGALDAMALCWKNEKEIPLEKKFQKASDDLRDAAFRICDMATDLGKVAKSMGYRKTSALEEKLENRVVGTERFKI